MGLVALEPHEWLQRLNEGHCILRAKRLMAYNSAAAGVARDSDAKKCTLYILYEYTTVSPPEQDPLWKLTWYMYRPGMEF